MKALIFDCDGVLADTERDGHRVAFNQSFVEHGIDVEWDIEWYGKMLEVPGGKERLRRFFDHTSWPAGAEDDHEAYLARLHADKTRNYKALVESGSLPLRPGIQRIVDEAIAAGLKLAVCSTASKGSVLAVMDQMGPERKSRFAEVLAGDVVRQKKPAPDIYLLALERLDVEPRECVVVEDSAIGMQAALAAGINCIVTTSAYTADENFSGARRVVPDLGEPPADHVTIKDLRRLCS
jgi:HAD superfamily hydrolase (TIGR01509 family)